jgi:hypothetical protein
VGGAIAVSVGSLVTAAMALRASNRNAKAAIPRPDIYELPFADLDLVGGRRNKLELFRSTSALILDCPLRSRMGFEARALLTTLLNSMLSLVECPLYPNSGHSTPVGPMSALRHKRTFAVHIVPMNERPHPCRPDA